MKVVFYGNYAIKQVRSIYEAAGWRCDEYRATGGNPLAKLGELIKLISADCVYIVSGCDVQSTRAYRLALKLRKKVIVHWIGTDVLRIREDYYRNPRKINGECENLADAEWLADELKEVGIEAEVIPIVSENISFSCPPMPKEHAVLTYIPSHRADFYGMDLVRRLAAALPEIRFYIVANDGENDADKLPNIVYKGFVDSEKMRELMTESTVLFRYPEHDGLSRMVFEALAAGRRVVYKYHYPYAITPASDKYEDILAALKSVLDEEPSVDHEASEYIKTELSREKMLARYKKLGLI